MTSGLESTEPIIVYNEELLVFLTDNLDEQMLSCQATGIPPPNVTWERFGQPIMEPLMVLADGVLVFPYCDDAFLGSYTCHARNVAGSISQVFVVEKVEDQGKWADKMTYSILGLAAALMSIVAILIFHYFNTNKRKKYREMKEVIRLLEGTTKKESGEDDDQHTDPAYCPYDPSYELQKDSFIIDRNSLLGEGEFSEVYKGHINGIDNPVAFKCLKQGSTNTYLKALASELKILMYIGKHENLVVLLGAYRKEIYKGVLYMAVELCTLGSLETFLIQNRKLFLKRLYSQFQADENNGATDKSTSKNSICADLVSLRSLLNWSTQIARGMAYLARKRVIHSDLAARNVLLTGEGIAKVTDFGLSRQIYCYSSEYIKAGKEMPLPWKWLAPECLQSHKFSTKSDVWAFGITLYEIFSLGDIPYPGTFFSVEFLERLKNGMRADKPKYATDEIYELMINCWSLEQNERPTFDLLVYSLQNCIFDERSILLEQEKKCPAGYVKIMC